MYTCNRSVFTGRLKHSVLRRNSYVVLLFVGMKWKLILPVQQDHDTQKYRDVENELPPEDGTLGKGEGSLKLEGEPQRDLAAEVRVITMTK